MISVRPSRITIGHFNNGLHTRRFPVWILNRNHIFNSVLVSKDLTAIIVDAFDTTGTDGEDFFLFLSFQYGEAVFLQPENGGLN